MSFNRLKYDTSTYKKNLNQSVGPGYYHLNQPTVSCNPCYPANSSFNLQRSGVSVNKKMFMIDQDSELMGLFRKKSNNPDKLYKPCGDIKLCRNGEGNSNGVASNCSHEIKLSKRDRLENKDLIHWPDCMSPPEDTRLSNLNCNLKEIGFNRFDWLCNNPQDKVEIPFAHNISNRIIVKDNHRPIIPNLISSEPCLPKQKGITSETIKNVYANNTSPQSTNWRCCNQIKNY